MNAGRIAFVHDDGETAPSYAVTVSEGALTDAPHAATSTFTNVNGAAQSTIARLNPATAEIQNARRQKQTR